MRPISGGQIGNIGESMTYSPSVARFVGVLAVLLAAPAIAQEHGQVGLSMGYPASVGIVWHVADRFAVRPELSLVQGSSLTLSTTTVTISSPFGTQIETTETRLATDNATVGAGVSGLFYLWKRESLGAFVSPRYAYTRGSNTTTATNTTIRSGAVAQVNDTTSRTHFFSGSFGAQYALGRRFSVFGEIGLGYTHGNVASPPSSSSQTPIVSVSTGSESKNHNVSTRSGAGVVFYFR
jgi:opacity protein-like surface antigen